MKVTVPKPPTTNHIYGLSSRGGFARMYITKAGKDWFEAAEKEIKKAYRKKHPIDVPCEVWVCVYTSTKRDADASNKPVLDALQKFGVIKNDYLFYAVHALRESCKKGEDRVEVEIMGY